MEHPSLAIYVLASLALIATPGQDMLYVISRSLAQGRFAGVCSALGVCLGILVHTALAALGVGAILDASEALFLALKLAGAAYLVYLGIRADGRRVLWILLLLVAAAGCCRVAGPGSRQVRALHFRRSRSSGRACSPT